MLDLPPGVTDFLTSEMVACEAEERLHRLQDAHPADPKRLAQQLQERARWARMTPGAKKRETPEQVRARLMGFMGRTSG